MTVGLEPVASYAIVHKEVAKRLDPKKFRVYAFSTERLDKGDLPSHITPVVLPSWSSSMKSLATISKGILLLPKILSIPPGIIHTIADPPVLPLRGIRRMSDFKGKHIVTIHGVPFNRRQNYIVGKLLCRDADVVTSVSKHTAQDVKRYYNVDSRVIYNGVDTRFFVPKQHHNDRLKILFVGRFRKIKRPWYVINLAKEFPQCDFYLFGNPYPLGPMLEEMSSGLKNVFIKDFIPHKMLKEIYCCSDVFLFPSVSEGFSLAVLEAMASGLPIICSNSGSLPELVENGKEGLLFNNYKEAKENLSYLIEDENIRKTFSKNAREKALKFDWDIIAKQYSVLYEEISRP
jgi:glycosyltransferase involved in cell wall biosynthesis